MPRLAEVYIATRTRNVSDAGTDDLPVMLLSRGTQPLFSKPLYGGAFRTATGRAGLFRFDLTQVAVDSEDLEVRLLASNDDAWAPEHVIAWGIAGRVGDERVIPLGAYIDAASPVTPAAGGTWISTDTGEGERELILFPVGRGRDATRARRLIVISATDAVFGMDTPGGRQPGALIPFVAASAFELRQMSADPAEGWHSIVLPTAKVLVQPFGHVDGGISDVVGVMAAPSESDDQPHPEDLVPHVAKREA